jgi:phage gpG-like protein
MTIAITSQLTGAQTITLTLNALAQMTLKGFHEQAAEYMKASVEENYQRQESPSGTPWRSHGSAYLQWLTERGASPGPVLQLTGGMRDSLRQRATEAEGVVYYASVSYGDRLHGGNITTSLPWIHTVGASTPKFPWRQIPARPQMGFSTSRDDVGALETMLKRFVESQLAATAQA